MCCVVKKLFLDVVCSVVIAVIDMVVWSGEYCRSFAMSPGQSFSHISDLFSCRSLSTPHHPPVSTAPPRSSITSHSILVPAPPLQILFEALGNIQDTFDMLHAEFLLFVYGEGLGCSDCVFDLFSVTLEKKYCGEEKKCGKRRGMKKK